MHSTQCVCISSLSTSTLITLTLPCSVAPLLPRRSLSLSPVRLELWVLDPSELEQPNCRLCILFEQRLAPGCTLCLF
ncbi:uncharacterized protein BDZ83DRAFT_20801 [Colletotrichum acutatum]|uniref:Uncharacterized protein n=1 Tax=Glomerella acutata TaxID=27357 RepID=A0AAD8XCC2_GLOAC|nr:uncharacterized protein BDZ83DRAFT_20801 [Colletotrichum acutatum]KAK1718136.1 hypothetical protein BDZ83DRAFT_20801 [Colletotrichum acutatum]